MNLYGKYKNNSTFTKLNKNKNRKIFELLFYDKLSEMKNHIKNYSYNYIPDNLEKANGILRVEFRLSIGRLKSLKKTYKFKDCIGFFSMLNMEIENILMKNLRSLYMVGSFYKLDIIKNLIETSGFKEKTKRLMKEFIMLSVKYKNSNIVAIQFEDKYGEERLKWVLKKFNNIEVIPVPISIRQPFDKWSFLGDGASF